MKCIGIEKQGILVGGCMYELDNGASVHIHVAVEPNWFSRDFLYACFHYPFVQLETKVLIGLVPEKNKKARIVDEHLGFTLQHTIPYAHPDGGLCIYTMYKHECRWLRIKRTTHGIIESTQSP